jgi:hypothetical protein
MIRRLVPVILVALVACTSYNATLTVSLNTVNAVSSEWNKWDTAHEVRLVADAPDKVAAQKAVDTYRKASEPVHKAILGAYAALLIASVEPNGDSIRAAANGVAKVVDELRKIGALSP